MLTFGSTDTMFILNECFNKWLWWRLTASDSPVDFSEWILLEHVVGLHCLADSVNTSLTRRIVSGKDGGVRVERVHGWVHTLELRVLEHGRGWGCLEHVVGEGWNRWWLEHCARRFQEVRGWHHVRGSHKRCHLLSFHNKFLFLHLIKLSFWTDFLGSRKGTLVWRFWLCLCKSSHPLLGTDSPGHGRSTGWIAGRTATHWTHFSCRFLHDDQSRNFFFLGGKFQMFWKFVFYGAVHC